MEGSFTSELSGDTSRHILDEASESVSGESIHGNVLETALPWNWGLCPSEVMIFEFALYFPICYFRLSDAMYHHGLQMCLRYFFPYIFVPHQCTRRECSSQTLPPSKFIPKRRG